MPTTCNYTVEKALTPEAREEALQIRFDVFIKEQGVAPDIESDELDAVDCHWLVRDAQGGAIATGRLTDKGNGTGKVERVAVYEAYRGKGVGRLLLEQMETEAKVLGFQRLTIHSQEYCLAFYQKQGFQVIDPTVFYEADLPHIALEKSI